MDEMLNKSGPPVGEMDRFRMNDLCEAVKWIILLKIRKHIFLYISLPETGEGESQRRRNLCPL